MTSVVLIGLTVLLAGFSTTGLAQQAGAKPGFDCGACAAGAQDGGMAAIPAGAFEMGSLEGAGDSDELPRHKVELDAFAMDKYAVTVGQYCRFSQATRRDMPRLQPASKCDFPVHNVVWEEAAAYCQWAGKRLPTEAEWEKAARCGTTTYFDFGDDYKLREAYAWADSNSGGAPHPGGLKKPNRCGLYDLYGNVAQWVSDWYDKDYYARSPARNPQGAGKGTEHGLRGGSWYAIAMNGRAGDRLYSSGRGNAFGIRCVSSPRKKADEASPEKK
ncbi:MAG: formylglycine-generating enzyme family protein [Elusimicrobia bacterium]|nr:formylglycine-generating enzyme family protein [Elusimicrobiota bacterium]